jgi:uncharacterized protein
VATLGAEIVTAEQKQALQTFVRLVRLHDGARLVDVFAFGSQARGDASEDSDADLAIIVENGDWHLWAEQRWLSDNAYDALIATGLSVHAWPVALSAWEHPEAHTNPRLMANMRRDAQRVGLVV